MIESRKVYIIAEAGVNHNGSREIARRLVDVAAEAGADAVKFQTFKAERVACASAPKAAYQQRTPAATESQIDMLRALELSEEMHRELIDHCRERGIQFLSTPFDDESVDLLATGLDLPFLKIPSGEITNPLLLLRAARTGKPVFLSTGMSTLAEVEEALAVLAFGYGHPDRQPSRGAFREAYRSPSGQKMLRLNVTLLHCTSEYPAPFAEVNLRAMDTLAAAFGLPVGYSDHTEGISVPLAAVARGAVILEKHFTIDRNLPGPDHKASLEPGELMALVQGIRQIESALGSARKAPSPSEAGNSTAARKSLVAAQDMKQGELFTTGNLTIKRPGTGVTPMRFWEVVGTMATRDYQRDEVITL